MFRKKGVQRAATPYIMFADSYIPVTVPSVTSSVKINKLSSIATNGQG